MDSSLNTVNDIDCSVTARAFQYNTDDLKSKIHIKQQDIIILTQNIRSIYNNFVDFCMSLSSLKISTDTVVLTEARLRHDK